MDAKLEGSIVRAGLEELGIERLVLSVHHVSFPASADDIGHGSPASARGRDFLAFVSELGFTGVALGPAGMVTPGNPSPYDGTVFARNPMAMAWGGLGDVAPWVSPPAELADHAHAAGASEHLVDELWRAQGAARAEEVSAWVARRPWMAHELELAPHAGAFALAQMILEEQHDAVRRHARALELVLYADMQVGMSPRDRVGREPLFLPGYAMGAPPSRTNPEGQPWGYPVLDPRAMGEGGAARAFFLERAGALLAHHDGLRVDHAHGMVCPWVYSGDVRDGARLHESPDEPDHPGLASLARVRPEQVDRELPRHHDHRVRRLEPAQVDAYAEVFDLLVARARAARAELMVEVLSTCPRPLAAVLERHGLGRFRVTQKARLDDAGDVYRADRARPDDWVMVGNHDTLPLALAVERAQDRPLRAAYLAQRLGVSAGSLERDPRALADAMLADLFLGPAKNVLVFWVDLFEGRGIFNRPGVVSPENWRLRIPPRFESAYGGVLGRAVQLALAARRR